MIYIILKTDLVEEKDKIDNNILGAFMKNKIRQKFIAGLLILTFTVTNLTSASFAFSDYSPVLRNGTGASSLGVNSDVKIANGDSIVNLSLRDADIKQVLRMFADQAGMNIIFSQGVSGTVTMDLVNIPLEKALNLVINTNNLYYDIDANTLVIANKDEDIAINNQKNMDIIPVKYVSANSIADFLNNNIFVKGGPNPGVSTKPIATVNPATNEIILMGTDNDAIIAQKIIDQFDRKPTITTFKVNHTTPAEMADMICQTLVPSMLPASSGSSKGGSKNEASTGFAAGIPTGFASDEGDSSSSSSSSSSGGSISVGGGKLVCTVEQQNGNAGLTALPYQNLSVSYFPTLGTIQVLGGSPTQIEMIRDYIAVNDKKTPQAYLEVQIVSLNEAGSKTFSNTWTFLSKSFSFNAGGSNGFSTNSMYPVFFAGRGFDLTDGTWNSDSQSYNVNGHVGKWSTSPQLMYAVNYLIENNKGRILANPKLLITSGQEATIDLTSDYVSKVTSQYLDNGSIGSQVQRDYEISDDNGIKVNITAFISPDGYITLDLNPEYNTISEKIYTSSEDASTHERDLVATLLSRRKLDLKGIRVKDGETLVIGGLIQETETKSVSKIPFLGDLPLLGMFFRSTGTEKAKEEMVLMITPQIIIDNEDATASDLL